MSFNAFWHCFTNGDVVLAVWRAYKFAQLSEQIIIYYFGLAYIWISKTQAKMAYISTWNV